jgi:aarF domain-containing kinase
MRAAANILQFIAPALSFVDPIECLNQFENVLERQVDLRHEAQALKRFGDNFKNDRKSKVRFATPFYCSENILIETYESGMHVSTLLNETVPRKSDDRLKQQVAKLGIRALLKMIFVDNFVHGDLHPGNILVQLRPDEETSIIKTTVICLKLLQFYLVQFF